MKVIGLIPARFKSSRFPGKPLARLLGKPMIIWVAELASQALGKDNVYIATDSKEIQELVDHSGYQTIMTSESALTGTDRLWQAAQQVKADIYVNIQGDEPLLNPLDITKIVKEKRLYMNEVINGMCPIGAEEDLKSINIPKVVFSSSRRLLYMSRFPVPGSKSPEKKAKEYWKQVCIYAFTFDELRSFAHLGEKSYLESLEDIEILRFLEIGIPVRMVETSPSTHAVDIPEDIVLVEELLRKKFNKC